MADKDTANEPKTKSSGGIVPIAVLGVACAAAAFGVVFFLAPSPGPANAAAACEAETQIVSKDEALASKDIEYVELEEMLVTIGDGAEGRFVKVSAVVMAPKGEADKVQQAQPMLTDAFLTYLRAVELSDYEAEDFFPNLREQLSQRAELVLGTDKTNGVLITEFLLR